MKPGGSMPLSQGFSNNSYPEPNPTVNWNTKLSLGASKKDLEN